MKVQKINLDAIHHPGALIPSLFPLHEKCEKKWNWYRLWHLKTYYPKVHLLILILYLIGVSYVFFAVFRTAKAAAVQVDTSTSASATANSSQRKTFYDSVNSKHWAFYYNGSAIEYAYSATGSSWTPSSTLAYNTANFSVTYKAITNGYVFVATECNTYDICIRRGTLGATTIDFTYGEQTVYNGDAITNKYTNPTIALNGSDYIWVAAKKSNPNSVYQAAASRSTYVATGDLSSWVTATYQGIPQTTLGDLIIVPQGGSNMLLVCGNNSKNIVAWRFDGSSWADANTGGDYGFSGFASGLGTNAYVSASVVSGDNLYVGGNFTTTYNASGSLTVNRLARYDTTTATFYQTGGGTYGVSGLVRVLAVSGDNLYVGGDFASAYNAGPVTLTVNRLTYCSIAANCGTFYTTGGGSYGVAILPVGSATVNALAVSGDNLYVGGSFNSAYNPGPVTLTVNNLTRCSIAANCGTFYTTGGGTYGVSAAVNALAVSGDNLYVGGNFASAYNPGPITLTVNRLTYCSIAANCGTFYTTGGGSYGVGTTSVFALAVSGDNLYVGGSFTVAYNAGPITLTVNRLTRCSIAASCGTFYQTGGGTYGVSGIVYALAVSGDNLYVGGAFASAYNPGPITLTVNYLTRCSIAASCGTFYQTGGGTYGVGTTTVYALAVSGDNLYVGGNFTTAYNPGPVTLTVNYLTRCSIAANCGTFYQTGGGTYGVNGTVRALVVSGDNLYVGGDFTVAYNTSGTLTVNRLTRYNMTTNTFYQTGGGTYGLDNNVYVLAVSGDNLYVGGWFTSAYNPGPITLTVNRLTRCSIAANCGTFYQTGGGTYGLNSWVYALAVSGDNLYVGGAFVSAYNPGPVTLTVNYLTRCSIAANCGTFYQTGGGTYGVSGTVQALAVSGDNLYVGGWFTSAYNPGPVTLTVNYLTRCSIAANCGTFYQTGGGTFGVSSAVYAFAVSGDNLYVGGSFALAYNAGPVTLTVNYLTRCSIAASCGTFYQTGGGTYGLLDAVQALAVSGDNLYVGGDFTVAYNPGPVTLTVNRLTYCSIAANCGTFYQTGGGTYGVNGTVRAFAVSGDNLYAGGSFTSADGRNSPYLTLYGKTVDADTGNSAEISATSDSSGNVYLIYRDQNDDLIFKKYDAGTNTWGSAVTVRTGTVSSPSIGIRTSNSDLYAFWIETNNVYYKKGVSPYAAGNWDASPTSFYATGTNTYVNTDFQDGGGLLKAMWTNGTGSPYTVYADFVEFIITFTWDGGAATGNWSDANNWDKDSGYPDGNDDKAMINTSSTAISTPAGGALTVGQVELGSGYSGTLTLGNNMDIDNSGGSPASLTISNASAILDLNGKNITVDGTYSNLGTLKMTGGETTVTLTPDTDSGTVEYYGTSGPYTIKNWTYYGLKINGAATTFNNPAALTVNGPFEIAAGVFDQGADKNLTVKGNFTIAASGATFTKGTGTSTLILDGTPSAGIFTGPATAQNLGVVQIGLSPGTTDLAADFAADSLTINAGDIFNTNGYEVDIGSGSITLATGSPGGTLDTTDNGSGGDEGDGTIITDAGNFTINAGGVFTKCVQATRRSLVKMDGGATKTFTSDGEDMGDFQTSTASTYINLQDNLTTEVITIDASTTLNTTASNRNINATNITINGTFIMNGSTITLTGNWNSSVGTVTVGTSTVEVTGSGTITTKSWNATFYHLKTAYTGQTANWANNGLISGTLTLFGDSTGHLTAADISQGPSLSGSITPIASNGATMTGGKVLFTGTYATIPGGTFYYGIDGAAGGRTFKLAGDISSYAFRMYGGVGTTNTIDLDGYNLTSTTYLLVGLSTNTRYGQLINTSVVTDSTVAVGSYVYIYPSDTNNKNILDADDVKTINISVATNWLNSDTFLAGNSTITFNGTADQTITTAATTQNNTFNNFTINNTGAGGSDDILLSGTLGLDINGKLTITDGDLSPAAFNTTIAGGIEFTHATNGSFTRGAGTLTFDGTGSWTDAGTSKRDLGTMTIDGTAAVLTLGSSAKATNITIAADDQLNLGAGSYTLELSGTGTPLTATGTFSKGTGSTVNYTGTGVATNITTVIYNNLTMTPTGATTYSLTGHLTGANALSGSLTINSNATLTTTVSNYNITLSGSWTKDGGFTANSGTVTFSGTSAATLTGSTTFNNLVMDTNADGAKQINFTAGTTQTISGTWTLDGAIGKVLTLRSTTPTSAWTFSIPAPFTSGDYIDVQDSWSADANKITAGTNCTNSGNNDGWIFFIPSLSFSLSSNSATFNNLNSSNSWTDTKTTVTTTTTNAPNGYVIYAYTTQLLTSLSYPAQTVANFYGTWATPQLWPAGTYGFGYTSSDTSVQGSDRFAGGTKFAAFLQTPSGNIVADSTGPVTDEQYTITYKVATTDTQVASPYQTNVIYIVSANF